MLTPAILDLKQLNLRINRTTYASINDPCSPTIRKYCSQAASVEERQTHRKCSTSDCLIHLLTRVDTPQMAGSLLLAGPCKTGGAYKSRHIDSPFSREMKDTAKLEDTSCYMARQNRHISTHINILDIR